MDQDNADDTGGAAAPPADDAAAGAQTGTIDIARLADKVYRLMRDELRLERARGASTRRR